MQEQEGKSGIEIKPYFVPVFDIGKPLSQEQLKGLVEWFSDNSYRNGVFYGLYNNERSKVGFGQIEEPTGTWGAPYVPLKRTRIAKSLRLPIRMTGNTSRNGMPLEEVRRLVTFADNALSWDDSISINPISEGVYMLERNCGHYRQCGLAKKPIFKRVVRRVLEKISP